MSTHRQIPQPVGFDRLAGQAAAEVRAAAARLLQDAERGVIHHEGSVGGLCGAASFTAKAQTVEFRVYDAASVQSMRAWHTYWDAHRAAPTRHGLPGGYDTTNPEAMAAAPSPPHYDIEYVVAGTYGEFRAWIEAPEQTSLFDLFSADQGGAAR
jgi:hypothetical protein